MRKLQVGDRVQCTYDDRGLLYSSNFYGTTGMIMRLIEDDEYTVAYDNGRVDVWMGRPEAHWKLLAPKIKRNLPDWW